MPAQLRHGPGQVNQNALPPPGQVAATDGQAAEAVEDDVPVGTKQPADHHVSQLMEQNRTEHTQDPQQQQ